MRTNRAPISVAPPSFSSRWRYEAGMHKLEAWSRIDRRIGTAEMRELLQTVAHGTTEYSIITRPNALEFDVAVASLEAELWDAPYRAWTKFAFDEVFPATSLWYLNSTVNEFLILIGRSDEGGFDVAQMEGLMAEPDVAESLGRVGIDNLHQLLDYFIGEGEDLDDLVGDVRLHRDDHPWIEFESAAILDRRGSWRHNLRLVLAARTSVVSHLRNADAEFKAAMAVHEAATAE